jgi:acetamidase/formamidase
MATLHETHTVWDHSIAPIHEVDPGATVELEVTDASGGQLDKDSGVDAVAALDFSNVNPVTGPVFVKGAGPGDVLEVEILSLQPRDWGWTAIIPGFGLLADEFPEPWLRISSIEAGRVAFLDDVVLPFEPFPGTIGVAPAEPGEHSIVPPTRWGGNLDIKHLRVGTRLLLPVGVEGALFSVGDTHAAQGDGEVCGTAIESAIDVSLKIELVKDARLRSPRYVTAGPVSTHFEKTGYEVTTGIGPDLMTGARTAVSEMIELLAKRYNYSPIDAYMLCSVCADLRISSIVDVPNWVVSFYFPRIVLE